MLRRIALVCFAVAVAFVVACGHQVTPEPNGNLNLAGKMQIRFRTNGPLDFTTYTYAIVIDTCGNGPPLPNTYETTFTSYSYAFLLGGQAGTAFPVLEQFLLNPSSANSLNPQVVPANPSLSSLTLNSNGQNTEFTLTFSREQLDNPLQVAQPCPNISPAPISTATASPSAVASTGASAGPSASPSPAPTSLATTSAQQYWYFNFFVLDATGRTVIDSLGIGGPTDNTFNGVGVETGSTNSNAIFKAAGGPVANQQAAQLSGGEIDNYL